ncbi:hypothetical protein JQK87_31230, partial [Streptomyces sp. G44]|nr:hypothetical protein [Streptomyces sp. G44]
MDQITLRPKPMPGRGTGGDREEGPGRSPCPAPAGHPGESGGPHTAGRRGRRVAAVLSGVLLAVFLVLCGVGIGTLGVTAAGMSVLTGLRLPTPPPGPAQPSPGEGVLSGHHEPPTAPKSGAPKPGAANTGTAHPGTAHPGTAHPAPAKRAPASPASRRPGP